MQVAEGTHLGLLQVFTTLSVPLVGNRNPQGRGRKPPSVLLFLKSPRPSLPLKRAPPLTPTLSPSGKREETAPPRRSEPLRSKVGGPSKVSPDCTGWDSMGMTGYSLYPGNLLITCRFLVVFLVVSRKKRNFGGKLYKLTELSQVSSTRPERAEAPSPGHRPG